MRSYSSAAPVMDSHSSSSSFLHAFLPLLRRCLFGLISLRSLVTSRSPALSTQLRVGGAELDEVKEGEDPTWVRQFGEDCALRREVLDLRTPSCLVFKGFEEAHIALLAQD